MGIVVVPQLVAAALVGTNVFALTTGNSKLHAVNASNPAAMIETAFYSLNGGAFLVNQKDPSAIVSHPASSRLYIQNASEGLPANMIFAVYNATAPGAVLQEGTINFGLNSFIGANGGNSLAIAHPIVYSLLGGDISATPASLRAINVNNPAAPVVIGAPVSVGTFADRPIKLSLVGNTLYVLSGGPTTATQKIFVYDVSNPLVAPALVTTLSITNTAATTDGVRNFFVSRDNLTINITTGGGVTDVHLLVYSTAGVFLGDALIA